MALADLLRAVRDGAAELADPVALHYRPARLAPRDRALKVRPKVADAFYSSPEWRALIASIIARRGRRCEACGSTGSRIYGDHIIELKDGGAPLDESNIQLLCPGCHTRKTAAERAKRHHGGQG